MVLAEGIVVRDNTAVGGGRGLFCEQPIARGEMVWREDPEGEAHYISTPRTLAWVEALPADAQRAYRHFMCEKQSADPSEADGSTGTRLERTGSRACPSSTTCRSRSTLRQPLQTRLCELAICTPLARSLAHARQVHEPLLRAELLV